MDQVKHLRKELEEDPESARGARRDGAGGGGGGPRGGGYPEWGMDSRSIPQNGTAYRFPYVRHFD